MNLWGQECELHKTHGSQYSTNLDIICRYPSFITYNTIGVCTIVVIIPVQSSLCHYAAKMPKKKKSCKNY